MDQSDLWVEFDRISTECEAVKEEQVRAVNQPPSRALFIAAGLSALVVAGALLAVLKIAGVI